MSWKLFTMTLAGILMQFSGCLSMLGCATIKKEDVETFNLALDGVSDTAKDQGLTLKAKGKIGGPGGFVHNQMWGLDLATQLDVEVSNDPAIPLLREALGANAQAFAAIVEQSNSMTVFMQAQLASDRELLGELIKMHKETLDVVKMGMPQRGGTGGAG